METKRKKTDEEVEKWAIQANALVDFQDQLTEWEQEFVESIFDQLDKGWRLRGKQPDILEKLYRKFY